MNGAVLLNLPAFSPGLGCSLSIVRDSTSRGVAFRATYILGKLPSHSWVEKDGDGSDENNKAKYQGMSSDKAELEDAKLNAVGNPSHPNDANEEPATPSPLATV